MEPQSCTKCQALPQDILMLACSHDLCLNCASDRLAFEMKKKKPANSIVCQFCYQRTPLDSQSVSQLQKLVNNKASSRVYDKSSREPQKTTKFSYDQAPERSTNRYQRTYERPPDRANPKESNLSYAPSHIVPAKKSCNQHPQQQILYFCFDCKCQCICPECVIHGKHKQHEVKTIKKSHPAIKAELEKNIDKLENNIESLLIKKSEVQKNIRSLNQQSSQSKRQIQQAFEQIRSKLELKQKEIIKTCDASLEEGLQQLEKYSKVIIKRIDQIKHQCLGTQDYLKRDQLTLLNFYARKWKQLNQETRQHDVAISTVTFPTSVLDLTDQIAQIGMSSSLPSRSGKY